MNDQSRRRSVQSNVLAVPFCEMSPTSLSLPDDLTYEQWVEVGLAIARSQGSIMWAIGDWWVFGEHRYGERAQIVESDDWEGPKHGTCRNAGTVCFRFSNMSSRDDTVSFRNHQAIAAIPDERWRLDVLAWVAAERPTRQLIEARVKEVKAFLSQGWTHDQTERKAAAEQGVCVVANMREQEGRQIDAALLAWAEANDRFVRIDRKTEWGNPFEMPDDGERADVVGKFSKFYLPYKDGLLSRMPQWIPPFEWVADLMRQADDAGCAVYLKSNLYRKESPLGGPRYRFIEPAPDVFHYLGASLSEAA